MHHSGPISIFCRYLQMESEKITTNYSTTVSETKEPFWLRDFCLQYPEEFLKVSYINFTLATISQSNDLLISMNEWMNGILWFIKSSGSCNIKKNKTMVIFAQVRPQWLWLIKSSGSCNIKKNKTMVIYAQVRPQWLRLYIKGVECSYRWSGHFRTSCRD